MSSKAIVWARALPATPRWSMREARTETSQVGLHWWDRATLAMLRSRGVPWSRA